MIDRRYQTLVRTAKAAQKNALCSYSHYAVGAAILTKSGKIYGGCNIETPTLINPICAERVAIGNAISHGDRQIVAVCTVSESSEPCGSCRQYIREFAISEDTPIISVHRNRKKRTEKIFYTTIGQLLPNAHTEALLHLKRTQ